MATSDFLENAFLNHVLRGVSCPVPASVWVALYESDPTDADVGVELSGGGYARQEVSFNAPVDGVASSSIPVDFVDLPASTVRHVGVRDSVVGGNLLFYGPLVAERTVVVGGYVVFSAGELVVEMS